MFCQHCGNPLADQPVIEVEAEVAETAVSAEVEIARICASRDIKLAQINARMTENVLDVEQQTELAAAEAKAEALESVLEPETPEAPEGAVVVVEAPEDPALDDGQVSPLPLAEDDSEPPGDKPKRSGGYGNSGWFS